MDYEVEWKATVAASNALARLTRQLIWALQRTPLPVIARTVQAWFERLQANHENVAVLSQHEKERIKSDKTTEERKTRDLAAQVARFNAEPAANALDKQLRNYIERRRRDTELSFPDAFNRFDGPAMLQVALLKEARRSAIDAMTPGELLTSAQRSLESRSATGYVDFGLIEDRLARGGTARTLDDGPMVKELREFVAAVQDLRIEPRVGIETVAENIREAQKAVGRAELLKLSAINPSHHPAAGAAFTAALGLYEKEAANQ